MNETGKFKVIVFLSLSIAIALTTLLLIRWLQSDTIVVYSGSPSGGGYYYLLGQELEHLLDETFAQVFNFNSGRLQRRIEFTHVPTGGAHENLKRIEEEPGKIGFTEEGLAGRARARALVRLYSAPLHIVVKSNKTIRGIESLKGRPVYVGAKGSGTRAVSELVMNQYGLKFSDLAPGVEDVNYGFNMAADALINGKLEAAFFVAGIGMEAMQKVAKHGGFTLLGLDRVKGITKFSPYLTESAIPQGTYPASTLFPAENIVTIEAEEVLICRDDLDDRTAYLVVEAFFRRSSELATKFPVLAGVSKTAQTPGGSFYPLHPGAAAYYRGESIPSRWRPVWNWVKSNWDIALTIVGFFSVINPLLTSLHNAKQRRLVQAQFTKLLSELDQVETSLSMESMDVGATRSRIQTVQIHAAKLFAQGEIKAEDHHALTAYAQQLLQKTPSSAEGLRADGKQLSEMAR
jgi:TRAP transporter TAXI family solute receptor